MFIDFVSVGAWWLVAMFGLFAAVEAYEWLRRKWKAR